MDTLDKQEMAAERQISNATLDYMRKASKWMRFVAIVGFIFTILMVLFAFALPQMMSQFTNLGMSTNDTANLGAAGTVVYLIIAAIFFLPNLFLFQSANAFSRYVNNSDANTIETGFKKLHSLYLFLGVIFIIYLVIVLLAVLGMSAAGL
jgi:nitrate reductase NapE component